MMQRSSSNTRLSNKFFIDSSVSQSQPQSQNSRQSTETNQQNQQLLLNRERLPTYDPLSHVAKIERSRLRFADNIVHVIPLILVVSAIVLWFFSSPESRI